MVFLHPIQERATRQSKKVSRVGPVPAMGVERKPDQGTLDRDEIDTARRNGHAGTPVGGVGPLNGNRCMLVGTRGQSHDPCEGKRSTD